MRNSIAAFTLMVEPLQKLLKELIANHGSKKSIHSRVLLDDAFWTPEHQKSFTEIKKQIAERVELTHLDPTQQLCLHTDASDHHHAAVLTQVQLEELKKPQSEQNHSPLAFISGTFTNGMFRWSTFEKGAFAIVHAMSRLDYLTATAQTNIYTDHCNIIFISDPRKQQPNMPAYLVSKIQR